MLAVAICLWRRERNWPALLDALAKTVVDYNQPVELAFWNNDRRTIFNPPENLSCKVHVINASENYVCLPRYHLPLLLRGEHFCFLDDDLLPPVSFLRELHGEFRALQEMPQRSVRRIEYDELIVGARGGLLGKDFGSIPRMEGPYIKPTEVDYLAGQSMFGSSRHLRAMLDNPVPAWAKHCEDLWFCFLMQQRNVRRFVVPVASIQRFSKRGVSLTEISREPAYAKMREMGFKVLSDA